MNKRDNLFKRIVATFLIAIALLGYQQFGEPTNINTYSLEEPDFPDNLRH